MLPRNADGLPRLRPARTNRAVAQLDRQEDHAMFPEPSVLAILAATAALDLGMLDTPANDGSAAALASGALERPPGGPPVDTRRPAEGLALRSWMCAASRRFSRQPRPGGSGRLLGNLVHRVSRTDPHTVRLHDGPRSGLAVLLVSRLARRPQTVEEVLASRWISSYISQYGRREVRRGLPDRSPPCRT